MSALGKSPLAGLAALGLGGLTPTNTGGLNPAGLYLLFLMIFNLQSRLLLCEHSAALLALSLKRRRKILKLPLHISRRKL